MKQLQQILDSARQVAGQAEVFRVSAQETPVQFEANRLKQVQTKESSSVSLRIIKEGRLGFSAASGSLFAAGSEKGGKGGVESLVEMAVETSRLANPVRFQFPSPGNYPGVIVFDPQIEKVTMEEMVELGSQLIARVREHTPGILCDARLTRGTSSVRMINSQGGEASYQKSFFAVGLEGVIIQGTDMLFVGDSEASCSLPDNRERVAERVIKQLEMAKGRASVSSKSLPVIFTPPGVASAFAGPLALAFNGKMALEGTSPLKDKLGKKVFDSGLSLWDDALQDYRLGSSPCDDEGAPSQRLPLITKGTASAFFYDLQTAALAGVRSTGGGRRAGATGQVKPGMSSLVIEKGEVSFQDMVENMKEGLVVEQLLGADQGNVLGGEFGGNVLLGYKVENGEIVGRVKDTMIAGNIYQALQGGLGIGSETRWVDGTLLTPYLYCPAVSVSAK